MAPFNHSPLAEFDSVFSSPSQNVVPTKDTVTLTITIEGMDATWLMQEASSRGISYNDLGEILIKQGMFFWSQQHR